MFQGFPKTIVIRSRPSSLDSALFEVYDHSDGTLVMRETPSQVAAWLQAFGYAWVHGSSGIWVRKQVRRGQPPAEDSRPSEPPRQDFAGAA